MAKNKNEIRIEATCEWNKLMSLLEEKQKINLYHKELYTKLEEWFNSSTKNFCDGGRYIVYAVFAFCWPAFLGTWKEFEGNNFLLIAIIVGFFYLAVDLFRNLNNSVKCRKLEGELNDAKMSQCVLCKMGELSDTSYVCVWIQFTFFLILMVVMVIFLAIQINTKL